MKNYRLKRISAVILSGSILFSVFTVSYSVSAEKSNNENNSFYTQASLDNWVSKRGITEGISIDMSKVLVNNTTNAENAIQLTVGSELNFQAEIQKEAEYQVLLHYKTIDSAVTIESRLSLAVNTQKYETELSVLWTDKERNILDRSGNETVPSQISIDKYYYGYLLNYSNINKSVLGLRLKSGVHNITLKSMTQSFQIDGIFLIPKDNIPSYEEYRNSKKDALYTDEAITVEAEEYSLKSDSYIRGENVQKNIVSPYENIKKKINVLSGGAWSSPGQKVLWEIVINETGWHRISLNYKQDSSNNVPIFRTIELDGEVPFKEWQSYQFENTGMGKFKTETLKVNGKDAFVYLEKGTHTLAFTVTIGYLEESYNTLLEIVSDINSYGSILKKLSAGSEESDRTWDMDSYMPSAQDDIYGFADRIDEVYKELSDKSMEEPVYADDLKYAAGQLRAMAEKENKIPNNTDMLCLGDSSATTYLISVISSMTSQALSVDKIYIHGENEINVKKPSFLSSIWDAIIRFLYSFTSDAVEQEYGDDDSEQTDELVVWSGDSLLGINILQQLLDETYNKENNKNIRIVYMQSDQRLILSKAVGEGPDVLIQAGVGIPFTYAIRGAAKNMLEYDDFLDFYTSQYSLESLVSMYCDEGVFGAVESRDFNVMYYRKDILDSLSLKVPNTWDDVKQMMPTLLRNSMNISHPLASGGAFVLGISGNLIYQNGGTIYKDDGSGVTLDSENSIAGLTEMTEMFTVYGAQDSVASFFNSFRYGQIPIGFGGFALYLQLEIAAPELAGLWDIAPMPGTVQEDGSISRATTANTTACMVFDSTNKDEEAWDFLKWWLSSETQSEYSRRRQTGYGTQYLWNTANEEAFETLPFTEEQKVVLREQFKNQSEIVNHPASYMVAREIGNIWNSVVLSHETLIDCVNNSVILSDREIKRKLQEFGYMDNDGKLVKEYTTNALEKLKELQGGKTKK